MRPCDGVILAFRTITGCVYAVNDGRTTGLIDASVDKCASICDIMDIACPRHCQPDQPVQRIPHLKEVC